MDYDYDALFEKIMAAVEANASITERMQLVIDECSRQRPHPDWKLFELIDFESDAEAIHDWLPAAFEEQGQEITVRGLWFGLVNLGDADTTTADIYVGGSPDFNANGIDWAYGLNAVSDSSYLNSEVLHEIYARAYRDGEGALGNAAEYPLALAYGAMAAAQSLQLDGVLVPGLVSAQGAAAGFDSGDFLFLGTIKGGRLNLCVKSG